MNTLIDFFKKNTLFFCFLSILSLASCTKETPEDIYIKTNLSKILELEKSDIKEFKETMKFEDNKLISWNNHILKKAYKTKDEYNYISLYLFRKLGKEIESIVEIDANGNETEIKSFFYDVNNKTYLLSKIEKWNAIFYIISTNCGYCTSEFKFMNELSFKFKDKGIKFVALFDKIDNIKNYKKGEIFKMKGFLNDDWIILEKNFMTPFLTKKYNDSLEFPFIFFRENNFELNKYPDPTQHETIDEFLSTSFTEIKT